MDSPRLPRFKRTLDVAPMELTERDREIIRHVDRHRFLRSPQILALVGGSSQQVLRRLQLLFHHGYLERPREQLDYFHKGGSHHMAYGLGNKGAAYIKRAGLGLPYIRSGEKNRSVARAFLEHALWISEIMVGIELACRADGRIRLLWGHELPVSGEIRHPPQPFRWNIKLRNGVKRGVVPDRVFALEDADGNRIFYFLEADRGTMPVVRSDLSQSSMYRKFLAYEATWLQSVHVTQFGFHRFRVLTVTTGPDRIASLIAACRQLEHGQGLFLFTDMASLEPGGMFSPVWQACKGKPESLLG
jgi:Replication-relaxation